MPKLRRFSEGNEFRLSVMNISTHIEVLYIHSFHAYLPQEDMVTYGTSGPYCLIQYNEPTSLKVIKQGREVGKPWWRA